VPQKNVPSLESVVDATPKPGKRPDWTSALSPSAMEELLAMRRKQESGEIAITKKALARAIVKWSHELGCPVKASWITIAAWLRQND
jgi:hypothetical protein